MTPCSSSSPIIMARHTGQPESVIARDTERDNFMGAEEAVSYGLVDKVIDRRTDNIKGKSGEA